MPPGTPLAGFRRQLQVSPEFREQMCPHTRVLLSDPKGKLSVEKCFSCFECRSNLNPPCIFIGGAVLGGKWRTALWS